MFAVNKIRQMALNLVIVLGLLGIGLAWSAIPALADSNIGGAVYTLTNETGGNAVVVFVRAGNGILTPDGTFATGGQGSGSGLGSEGSVVLSSDGRWLFAVNAGSNDISSFAVRPHGLALVSRVSAGGTTPISLTNYKNLLYVVNAGGSGNISGFTVAADGMLAPLAGSAQFLSNNGTGAAPGPAQIQFDPNGKVLVVTEKDTNRIDTYVVGNDGRARAGRTYASSGNTPFGFDFARSGALVVSEAAGGAAGASSVSSYQISQDGNLAVVSASVHDTQTAACWLVITGNGRYAFTANAGSDSISSYKLEERGNLSLLNATAAQEAAGSHPIDMALTHDSQYLYQLNTFAHTIAGFQVQADGSLTPVGNPMAVSSTAVGLAAR